MGTEEEKKAAKKFCEVAFIDYAEQFLSKNFTPEICEEILGVPIILGPRDAFELFIYAQEIPNGGTYLEIGSARGGSLKCAFLGAKSVDRKINLIGIEPYPSPDFIKNTKDLPNLTFYRMKSDEVVGFIPDESVNLIFIDGDHTRSQVFRDISNYWKKLKLGRGIILGDNWNDDQVKLGVTDAVQNNFELLKGTNFFKIKK